MDLRKEYAYERGMKILSSSHTNQSLPLASIGEQYSRYRLVDPKSDKAMVASFKQHGQLTPVIVGPKAPEGYPLIDGFKRLRACRQLGICELRVQILDTQSRAIKAAIFHLNRQDHSMTQFEEGMIVRSLKKDDGLTQVEIATLLGCHKSWVCRRFNMIENLSEEVLDALRLGLIGVGLCRELIRLPRGNQAEVLASVHENRLSCRQTARLVKVLDETPESEHAQILSEPLAVLSPPPSSRPAVNSHSAELLKDMDAMKQQSHTLRQQFRKNGLVFSKSERTVLLSHIKEIEADLDHFKNTLTSMETPDEICSKS
jgi:ParB/RepB/Spo0J family partition protein